jgi:RNA processing factor Prp31
MVLKKKLVLKKQQNQRFNFLFFFFSFLSSLENHLKPNKTVYRMVKFIFTNCLGNHVFNNNYKYAYSDKDLKTIEKKTKDARPIPPDKIVLILDHFRDKSYFDAFYKENILRTKEQLQNVVSDDQLITQAISTLEDLKHTINTLSNRGSEWYSW